MTSMIIDGVAQLPGRLILRTQHPRVNESCAAIVVRATCGSDITAESLSRHGVFQVLLKEQTNPLEPTQRVYLTGSSPALRFLLLPGLRFCVSVPV